MTSYAELERARLADALEAAGPAAPTLCDRWTARDLAAHVVARERRPDSTPGILLRRLAGWTDHVRRGYAARPYAELIGLIRAGPPRTSPFALPGVDAATNLAEFFVHCEDVRRGGGRAAPAERPAAEQDELWRRLVRQSRLSFRRVDAGVVLATPDGREHVASARTPSVRLVGEPGELLLAAFGRGGAAVVRREGPPEALAALASARLGV